ncbi:PTS sugar transporter subunit IIB [Rothia halotolerans]|jgi:ascorbate PTS system EIIB component|uniref:PTS sugar transporter subunit IIB n=1 Tax=Rothia halotolerans TaxID=405770 RepID=UPI00101CF766|nr:PTS sugar transporter subunit IIB [Rothia halotolerans]
MKIVTVCGMGIGTSVLLKMNTEKALRALDLDGEVEAADIGVARGMARSAQIVLTSAELAEEIGDVSAQVIVIDNFTDSEEIGRKLSEALG